MTNFQGFPSSFYGEPGVLGMLSNGISAFLVLLLNFHTASTGVAPTGLENILAGVHLILIGGCCQLVAGLLSFRKYDHLSATAFVGYAALWGSYGATRIFFGTLKPTGLLLTNASLSTGLSNATDCRLCLSLEESAISGLIPYILLSFLLAFCAATVNYIMPLVFGAITATLAFEAAALVAGSWALVVSGLLELLILVFAIYGSSALLLKGLTQRLTLGGFGTPLFNVLLLGTGTTKNSGEEKKKMTKYAEPMALGLFCDTVSAFILTLYNFGYVQVFGLGAVWVSVVSIAQVLSSYYAHLRLDCYHTTKFGLHATFWLVRAWEEFASSVLMAGEPELSSAREAMLGNWMFVMAALAISVVGLNMDVFELIHNLLFALLAVSSAAQIPLEHHYTFAGVAGSLLSAASLYGTFSRLINTLAEKTLIPVGPPLVATDRLRETFSCSRFAKTKFQTGRTSDALFYLLNGVAALSALHASRSSENSSFLHLTILWVLIPGGVVQVYISRLQAAGSGRFSSVISACYAAVWATWTWYRFAGDLLQLTSGHDFTAGAAAFLVINGFLVLIAAYQNLVLVVLTTTMELLLVCFLLSTLQILPYQLEMTSLALFTLTCVYGTLSSLLNQVFSQTLLPEGAPLLQKKPMESLVKTSCISVDSRLTSSIMRVAEILDQGGVCGIPTDTVYALAASCKNPEAIEQIYNIKDRPSQKPVCICISSVSQLQAAEPPFSRLLWDFMTSVYPGGVSCVVRKGAWLLQLGVGAAYEHVGTADSIMIRIPDHTVTAHLCHLTGPLAITSANPSGEEDSRHHDTVLSRLGHKIQAVLCDGQTREVVGSTVVDCLRIDEGVVSVLREGCVSTLTVERIFQRVKAATV